LEELALGSFCCSVHIFASSNCKPSQWMRMVGIRIEVETEKVSRGLVHYYFGT
jgi:hypothetical protein